ETFVRCRSGADQYGHPEFRTDFGGYHETHSSRREAGECEPCRGETEHDYRDRERTANTHGRVFHHCAAVGGGSVDDQRIAEVDHAVDVVDAGHEVHPDDEGDRGGRGWKREERDDGDQRADTVARDRDRRWSLPERLPCRGIASDRN